MRVLVVFGTRPEAIKMAPLVFALKQCNDCIDTKVCVTGQHREMLDQVLELFQIVPDYDLDIMHQGQTLYDVTSKVLVGMGQILREAKPDIVLVHGDTTTAMAAALASFYEHIPVGHVEAGLRTNNIYSPWPEEINRQITSRIATLHFAPTKMSKQNLTDENVKESKIVITGNTVIDALYYVVGKINEDKCLSNELIARIQLLGYDLKRIGSLSGRKMVLITGHRRENFGGGFENICNALNELSFRYPNVDFVYPMHLNPNVRNPINNMFGAENKHDNLFFIEPLGYFEFVLMMERCYLVLTDSGGIQEEAPSLGKPVLVMRDTTERPEAVSSGTVKLVGANTIQIVHEVSTLLDNEAYYQQMSDAVNPYGDGHASQKIVNSIKSLFGIG